MSTNAITNECTFLVPAASDDWAGIVLEMARADFFLGPHRPRPGTSRPMTITDPATHTKIKPSWRKAHSLYDPLIALIKLKRFQKLLAAR